MDDMDNQLEGISKPPESTFFDQAKTDEANMKNLNKANRVYRKCVAGKCPPVDQPLKQAAPVRNKKKQKKTQKFRDNEIAQIWRDVGRKQRMAILKKEVEELRIKVAVAESKVHVDQQEKNFKIIKEKIMEIEMNEAITRQANLDIAHLKSQIERVRAKRVELSRQTPSEDNFTDHWKKADKRLETMKNRLHACRQLEGELAAESCALRKLIVNMLFDRKVFNTYWSKLVGKLKDRRKFLLEMIDRSNTAYILGADILDNLKQIEARRQGNKNYHISEMYKTTGAIDANETNSKFLGGKGAKRHMAPLELREVNRREVIKTEYNEKLNFYGLIVGEIKKFMGTGSIEKARDQFLKVENEGFQYYNFMNEMNYQIEKFVTAYTKQSEGIRDMQSYTERKVEYYDQRNVELRKRLAFESEKTLKAQNELEKLENTMLQHYDSLLEIMKILRCDLTPIQHLLGDHKNVYAFNLQDFFTILEKRLNEVIAIVYCAQRKNRGMLEEDPRLLVKSLRREDEKIVQIEDVITTQQCAECAESSNVNRSDEEVVYPLDHEVIRAKMRALVREPEMAARLHSVSKCNLPNSVVVATRRDAE